MHSLPLLLSTFLAFTSAAVIPVPNDLVPAIPEFEDSLEIARRAAPPGTPGPSVLEPINIDEFEVATGQRIQARDEPRDDLSGLDLKSQAKLAYGAQGEDGIILLANMTLQAPAGMQIINMERFAKLTKAADCDGTDGKLGLTFKGKQAFDYALKKWSIINEDTNKKFIMITDHEKCGANSERLAYIITDVQNDEKNYITYLKAKLAPWSEVAGTFDMDFGRAVVSHPTTKSIEARGWFDRAKDKIKGAAGKVKDGVEKGADKVGDAAGKVKDGVEKGAGKVGDAIGKVGDMKANKEVVFSVNAGTPGKRSNIFTDRIKSFPRLVVDCTDCFITGKFRVAGSLSVDNFKVKQLTFDASPENFRAAMKLDLKVADQIWGGPGKGTGNIAPPSLNFTAQIASFAIPGAGFSVPKIFNLGAVLTYEVGVESGLNGMANFSMGLSTTLPNSANLKANVIGPESSSATGWDGATMDPSFNVQTGSATINLAAFSQPKLTFGVDIVGIGKLEAGLRLRLPTVNANMTAVYDKAGVCAQTAGASKTGFRLGAGASVELYFGVNGKVGASKDATTLFERRLFMVKKPLLDKCYPIEIKGLSKRYMDEEVDVEDAEIEDVETEDVETEDAETEDVETEDVEDVEAEDNNDEEDEDQEG